MPHTHTCKKSISDWRQNLQTRLLRPGCLLGMGVRVSRPSLIPLSVCLGRGRGRHARLRQRAGEDSWPEAQAQEPAQDCLCPNSTLMPAENLLSINYLNRLNPEGLGWWGQRDSQGPEEREGSNVTVQGSTEAAPSQLGGRGLCHLCPPGQVLTRLLSKWAVPLCHVTPARPSAEDAFS